jgi:tetratricopeptide (TPR) repeat protein
MSNVRTAQLFSGQLPFEHIRSDFAVMIQVMRGARPSKPSASIEVGFTDDLWDIMQRGWAETPSDRPSLAEFWQVIAPGEITLREHQTVTLLRQALDLLPPGHRDCSNLLDSLADTLWTRFERLGDFVLLAEIIGLHRQALDLRPPGHLDRGISLNNLAAALQTQFDGLGEIDLLEEAVDLHRQALYLRPPGHPDRSSSLNNLASALNTRFEERGDLDVLKEAIELHRQALDLRPPAHPHRSDTLSNLANTLQTLCEQLGDFDSLSEAVQLHREALALRPPGHPDRSDSLNNLASALSTRFVQLGDLDLLTEAIVLHREALELRPPGHPHRSDTLSNLASAFNIRFEQLGDFDSLTEAVDMLRQALDLLQPGHPSRSGLLDHLANALHAQFEQMGDIHVLAEAIVLHRQALGLRLHGHPRRSDTLTNLARALSTRFEQLGDPESLSEAVEILRQALDLLPPGHHGRSGALNNLANALQTRFEQLRDFDLLAEACDLHRHALGLRPPGHPDRPRSLNNLATALHAVSMQTGDHAPLTEAVELLRHALELCPHSHPQRPTSLANLGIILAAYPSHRLLAHNLNERLHLAREGLRLCAGGYHLRMWFLISIAECLLEPGLPFFDFADGIRYVLEGLQDRALPTRKSLRFAVHALRTVEVAQQFMIRYAGDVIQPHDDSMVLQVYRLVLQLFPRAASLAHDHAGRLRELSGADPMSRNAATRAIIMNRGQEAIELLEEGRGLFWAQAHQLRNQDLDLVPDQDAQELRRLFKILEAGDMRNNSMSSMQREQLDEDRRRVVEAAEALIADIRSRPGMSRFLLPPMFSSLVQSMPETGFVIVLVASSLGHRALVLSRTQDQTVSLELFPPKGGFASVSVRGSLPRGGESAVLSAENTNVSRGIRISKGTRDSLGDTLAQLWMSIVKPVIDVLGLKVCSYIVLASHILTWMSRLPQALTVPASGGVSLASLPSFPYMLPAFLEVAITLRWWGPVTTSCRPILPPFQHSAGVALNGVRSLAAKLLVFWRHAEAHPIIRH